MQEDVQGPSLPSKTCSEGQMYAAEEVSVSTVSQVIQGVSKERHPHPDLP